MSGIEMTPEMTIEKIKHHDQEAKELRSLLIDEHFGFIVHTITSVTGRYVEVENSEELSIGLLAFDEAIGRYDASKGASFLTYARLVITSRVRDFHKKISQREVVLSFDDYQEENLVHIDMVHQSAREEIAQEIEKWESILIKFGFDIEELVDETPKHEDTRNNAIKLSENISEDKDLVDKMYMKFRLPISMIVLKFTTTKKVVKHSKKFIIATVVILTKNLKLIRRWIYKDKKGCPSC